MAKCLNCGEEITYLIKRVKKELEYYFEIDKNKQAHYEPVLLRETTFQCPDCNEILFTDEESALKFLKG